MNLIIDQGNTNIKIALFEDEVFLRKLVLQKWSIEACMAFMEREKVEACLVSSVVDSTVFRDMERNFDFPVFELSIQLNLPFTLDYETPDTLGLDRIALAAAAIHRFPGKDCLVVDAGTCITYDFIEASGTFLGGAISPGMEMRFKALNHYTARLPLTEKGSYKGLIGNSTVGSIASGVITGMVEEVRGTIERYELRFPQLVTVITGGDAAMFDDLLKNSIFAAPEFLLQGLNNILDYHAEML